MGTTTPIASKKSSPVNYIEDGTTDGYYINEKCFGTYIHGILDNANVIEHILAPYTDKLSEKPFDLDSFKNEQYDKLANHLRQHINIDLLYQILKQKD